MSKKDLNEFFCINEDGHIQSKGPLPPLSLVCSRADCLNVGDRKGSIFKRCAKCKTPYCSRECQKSDWPSHKKFCNDTPEERGVLNAILERLATEVRLQRDFEVLTILQHGLHLLDDEDLVEFYSKPLGIDLFVQYEPANIKNFFRLFNLSALGDTTPMSAIPQIVSVQVAEDETLLNHPTYAKILDHARASSMVNDTVNGLPITVVMRCQQTVGLGEVVIPGLAGFSSYHANIVTFALTKTALDIARNWYATILNLPIRVRGQDYVKEMNVSSENLIEFINGTIRADAIGNNVMRLRAKYLPDYEKQMISVASVQIPVTKFLHPQRSAFVDLVRRKIAREYIYHFSAARYGYPKSILPAPVFKGHLDNGPPSRHDYEGYDSMGLKKLPPGKKLAINL